MTNESKTIHINYKGKMLEVASSDLPKKLNLIQATRVCNKLNEGWRLPTSDELEIIYKDIHKKNQGNFNKKECYWTSSKTPDDFVVMVDFSNGRFYMDDEESLNKVRVVRNI